MDTEKIADAWELLNDCGFMIAGAYPGKGGFFDICDRETSIAYVTMSDEDLLEFLES